MREVSIWTDGAARGNPGPGGYGALLRFVDREGVVHEREYSGGYRETTNNRMELMGVIVALEALRAPCQVRVTSDSTYVTKAFNEHWIDNWKRRGWITSGKEPVKNRELWERLLEAAAPHEITWCWIKGHAGHEENERCDALATAAADQPEEALGIDDGGDLRTRTSG